MNENTENLENASKFMAGCAGAGCMLYLIGFVLMFLAIFLFALLTTPNPFG